MNFLEDDIDFYIITSNVDHDGTCLSVKKNIWVEYGRKSKVAYLDKRHQTKSYVSHLIVGKSIDVVYINGVFSLFSTIIPLRLPGTHKVIIAPRGMLQSASLSLKATKKKIYLSGLRAFFLSGEICWHLTTSQEKEDFLKRFNHYNKNVRLIGNIPSLESNPSKKCKCENDVYILGSIALISPMKNIDLILRALKHIKKPIKYIIYGPIKDKLYWEECQKVVKELPDNIEVMYNGAIDPAFAIDTMKEFDFYIQPSKSENFGHSIFEAMRTGLPVIISDQTPWRNLRTKKAGWDIDTSDLMNLVEAINEAINLSDSEYREYCHGAIKVTERYIKDSDLKNKYLKLFSPNS